MEVSLTSHGMNKLLRFDASSVNVFEAVKYEAEEIAELYDRCNVSVNGNYIGSSNLCKHGRISFRMAKR